MNGKGMGGDFRGDFSRDTFDPAKQFSRVLMQQGRVQLDADWNEQVSILLHYMRQLGADLMGPHSAPSGDDGEPGNGFLIKVTGQNSDFYINEGSYYVNGIRCYNEKDVPYSDQPNYPFTEDEKKKLFNNTDGQTDSYLVYLDVWERHLTYVEDDDMREKALGKADTASRAKVVWQVRGKQITESEKTSLEEKKYQPFLKVLGQEKVPGTLKVQAKKVDIDKKACITSPEAIYRGAENQLYRVEIHKSNANGDTTTFKWSRENGSVIFPIRTAEKVDSKSNVNILELEHLGYDSLLSLQLNNWVEVIDDDIALRSEAKPLLQVIGIDRECEFPKVTLSGTTEYRAGKHPYLRRWDHKNVNDNTTGTIQVLEETKQDADDNWILLENNIRIQFQAKGLYQTGDYWLIPARTATGDVEWPKDGDENEPAAIEPCGVKHHYAPLAIITVKANGQILSEAIDLRRQLRQAWDPAA